MCEKRRLLNCEGKLIESRGSKIHCSHIENGIVVSARDCGKPEDNVMGISSVVGNCVKFLVVFKQPNF